MYSNSIAKSARPHSNTFLPVLWLSESSAPTHTYTQSHQRYCTDVWDQRKNNFKKKQYISAYRETVEDIIYIVHAIVHPVTVWCSTLAQQLTSAVTDRPLSSAGNRMNKTQYHTTIKNGHTLDHNISQLPSRRWYVLGVV